MNKLDRYQGEDIAFSIKIWKDANKTELLDLDKVSEIVVYIYTDGCKRAEFTKQKRQNYIPLTKVSSTEYSGIVDSAITKMMSPGTLNFEINIAENEASISDGKWNLIQRTTIGVLRKTFIKRES